MMKTTTRKIVEELAQKLGFNIYAAASNGKRVSELAYFGPIDANKDRICALNTRIERLEERVACAEKIGRRNDTLIWRLVAYFGLTLTTSAMEFVKQNTRAKRGWK